MRDRTAYVLFSDDIRDEVGNKKSLMGIYGPQVFVPMVPIVLPRFCATATLVFRQGDAPKHLSMEMTFRDTLVSRGEIDPKELEASCAELERDMAGEEKIFASDEPPMGRITMHAMISPFVVSEPGRIVLTVETERGRIRAGSTLISTQS